MENQNIRVSTEWELSLTNLLGHDSTTKSGIALRQWVHHQGVENHLDLLSWEEDEVKANPTQQVFSLDDHEQGSYLRGILSNQKSAHTMHTTRTTRLRCLSSHAFYDFVDRVVHRVNAPRAPLNQCEPWSEVGGSSHRWHRFWNSFALLSSSEPRMGVLGGMDTTGHTQQCERNTLCIVSSLLLKDKKSDFAQSLVALVSRVAHTH